MRVFKVVDDRSGNQHKEPYGHTRRRGTLKTTTERTTTKVVSHILYPQQSSLDVIKLQRALNPSTSYRLLGSRSRHHLATIA